MAFYHWLGAILVIFAIHFRCTYGHGAMVKPINWIDKKTWIKTPEGEKFDYHGIKSSQMCLPGCELKSKDLCPHHEGGCPYKPACPGSACYWYTNWTFVEKPTLFDHRLRTYTKVENKTAVSHTPWRAPGSAKLFSSCGVAGGNPNGCIGGGCNQPQGGYGFGIRAEDFKFKHEFHVTNWTRGEVVEVAWGIIANHGGGYSYRLCKLPKGGVSELTEECFQRTPLKFVGDLSWAQYGENGHRIEMPAIRVDKGTFPEGSQWTRNPIPACQGNMGGGYSHHRKCDNGYQFEPINSDLCGFGEDPEGSLTPFKWSIVDKVQIPKDIESGDYVLSWRWDGEQFPQVWSMCSSIYID